MYNNGVNAGDRSLFESMYYILSPEILPVGYLKLPYAIHDLKRSRTEFLNRELFTLVYHCDGQHDIDPDSLSGPERSFLDGLVKKGFASVCDKGTPLKPYQEYRYYDNRFKDTVHWSVTGRCNYRCRHCFMSAPDARFGHCSTKQCMDIIDQIEECGIRNVSLTGGEPLIREDLPEIISSLTEHRIRITAILTNGALVNDSLLDTLENNRQHPSFQMSYDGKGWHDWMRGVDGAEEKVLDAFRLLKQRGFSSSSAMALHRGNADVIRESVLQLRDAGCGSLKINVAYPSGEWLNHPEYFLTTDEGYERYLEYIPRYFEDDAPIGIMLEGAFTYDTGAESYSMAADRSGGSPDRKPVCASLRKMVYIGPEGEVLPCQSMISSPILDKYPNVFSTPLRDILKDSEYTRDACSNVSSYMERNPECASCRYSDICCGGCRATGIGSDGKDFFAPDMRTCDFYRKGWYEKFRTLADSEFSKFAASGGVERGKARRRAAGTGEVSQEPVC